MEENNVQAVPATTDKTDREILEEIRDSQLRTEELVNKFIADFAQNPMMKTMGKMFGKM